MAPTMVPTMTRHRAHQPAVVRRGAGLVAVVAVLAAVLSGCSGLAGTGDGGYVEQPGSIAQVAPEDRDDPIALAGETLEGERLDVADLRGEVVVVNVWGSWCPPCRAEVPFLVEADAQLDVPFVGVNIREEVAPALAFEEKSGIGYPSIHDQASEALLGLGRYAPRSPPVTLVLDREGRVAAVVSGALTSALTLTELVEEVLAEDG